MKRTVIIVDHEDDFNADDAAEIVAGLAGANDVAVAEQIVVCAAGNPFDGLTVTGPFMTDEEAVEYSDDHDDSNWVVTAAAVEPD